MLTFRQKIKTYLGYDDKQIDDIEKEILQELAPPQISVRGNGGIGGIGYNPNTCTTSYGLGVNGNSPFQRDNTPNFEVVISGSSYCKIEKDSELYFKIIDAISGMILNILDQNNGMHHFFNLENIGTNKNFADAVQKLLCQELLTSVNVIKVETFKDYQSMNDLIKIGITLQIDQKYIDNYSDIETQQLIDLAMK